MKLLVDGVLVEESEARISVFDQGFLYGIGLFETFRTYGGTPFLLAAHHERLRAGCEFLRMPWHHSVSWLEEQIDKVLQANELEDAYVRLSVTPGGTELGLPGEVYDDCRIIIYVKPLPERPADWFERGRKLQLLQTRRSSPEGQWRLKSFQFMNNILGMRELRSYPWSAGAEGLFLNAEGYLTEGIVSNLFFVRAGVLYTPDLSTGALPGITRCFVKQLWADQGAVVVEGHYTTEQLLSADEAFITNSVQELTPITGVYDGQGQYRQLADGLPGSVTRSLHQAYQLAAGGCDYEG